MGRLVRPGKTSVEPEPVTKNKITAYANKKMPQLWFIKP